MATPQGETRKTQRSGISLDTFEDVKLFKRVPVPAKPTTVEQALHMLENDKDRLLSMIHAGMIQDALQTANSDDSGWLQYDENGKETDQPFSGSLVSSEILNPMVLQMCKNVGGTVIRDGQSVEIFWDDCKNAEEKRALKEQAMEFIKGSPKIVAGMKKKMAAAAAE